MPCHSPFFLSIFLAIVASRAVYAGGQVDFITRFYEVYLNSSDKTKVIVPFSKGAKALLSANDSACALSRGDDICGFGADGDIYLDGQEVSPKLNFKSSEFKATVFGKNSVDVSFTVWPGAHDYYVRKLRFILAKENGAWRVDDILYGSKDGKFSPVNSMRGQIEKENVAVRDAAQSLNDAWTWIVSYLREPFLDRFARFVAFPIEVCDDKGACEMEKKGGTRFDTIARALHEACPPKYVAGDFGKKESGNPRNGELVKKGALTFRFLKTAWWIVKVDLREVGTTF